MTGDAGGYMSIGAGGGTGAGTVTGGGYRVAGGAGTTGAGNGGVVTVGVELSVTNPKL